MSFTRRTLQRHGTAKEGRSITKLMLLVGVTRMFHGYVMHRLRRSSLRTVPTCDFMHARAEDPTRNRQIGKLPRRNCDQGISVILRDLPCVSAVIRAHEVGHSHPRSRAKNWVVALRVRRKWRLEKYRWSSVYAARHCL